MSTIVPKLAPTLIHTWSRISKTSGLNICKMLRKTEVKSRSHFSSFNIMSYLIYTDLISSFLDPKLVDPRSTLIHVGAYDPYGRILKPNLSWIWKIVELEWQPNVFICVCTFLYCTKSRTSGTQVWVLSG